MFARQELETTVGKDGQIIIKFPESAPVGATVRVTVEMQVIEPESLVGHAEFGTLSITGDDESVLVNTARDAICAKMAAIGMLDTAHMPPDDLVAPSEAEWEEVARRASERPSILEIMDEIRGER